MLFIPVINVLLKKWINAVTTNSVGKSLVQQENQVLHLEQHFKPTCCASTHGSACIRDTHKGS